MLIPPRVHQPYRFQAPSTPLSYNRWSEAQPPDNVVDRLMSEPVKRSLDLRTRRHHYQLGVIDGRLRSDSGRGHRGLRSRMVAIAGTIHPSATVSGAKRSAAVVARVDGGKTFHALDARSTPTLAVIATTRQPNHSTNGWVRGGLIGAGGYGGLGWGPGCYGGARRLAGHRHGPIRTARLCAARRGADCAVGSG